MATASGSKNQYFSIDDAFEEETDEAIKIYGLSNSRLQSCESISNAERGFKHVADDATSKDSDSLIPEYAYPTSQVGNGYWWQHPKIQENWKTVLSAVILLLVGIILLSLGIVAMLRPEDGLHWAVFLLAGLICFIPGAYHVVYIWLAASGKRGYDFHHLPLFT
ncbi:transmembrane protein 134 isoform X2 [Ctenocephalides felis]|uniref:transmembrane protein 134 isoform X2 n=1 Tax=Ctenocephalides felis TaxID=7515 RepID=UPI000E6E45DC|nr:transmembrane protein 134 isoform X2 [Ctenocephalides felis]